MGLHVPNPVVKCACFVYVDDDCGASGEDVSWTSGIVIKKLYLKGRVFVRSVCKYQDAARLDSSEIWSFIWIGDYRPYCCCCGNYGSCYAHIMPRSLGRS